VKCGKVYSTSPILLLAMKEKREEKENPNFIPMSHGKLAINVPKKMFVGSTAQMREEEVRKFKDTLSSRYPWLTKPALDIIVEEARQAMKEYIERRKGVHQKAREMMARGNLQGALKILENYLIDNADDADAWYVVGEVLSKMGRQEEGFRAIARARDLSKKA